MSGLAGRGMGGAVGGVSVLAGPVLLPCRAGAGPAVQPLPGPRFGKGKVERGRGDAGSPRCGGGFTSSGLLPYRGTSGGVALRRLGTVSAAERVGDGRVVPPDPAVWQAPEMRRALEERDIGRVYRILRRLGFTQNRLGTLTGQSQPEISAIMNGRNVVAVVVLARIADGLGIPPGYLGLACCPCPHSPTRRMPSAIADGAVAAGIAEAGNELPMR